MSSNRRISKTRRSRWVCKSTIVRATSEQEIHATLPTVAELKAGALLVTASPRFLSRREQIVALAAQYEIPAIYEEREFAEAGGLMTTAPACPKPIAKLASTPGASSRAKSRPICRSCNRPSSSSSSTSRLRRRSASKFRRC